MPTKQSQSEKSKLPQIQKEQHEHVDDACGTWYELVSRRHTPSTKAHQALSEHVREDAETRTCLDD